MASRGKIQVLYQQARLTFSKKKGPSLENGFSEELGNLKTLVHSLTATDFDITPDVTKKRWDYKPYVTDSPAACMEVYECQDFIIGLFLIKPQKSIPLHNHPGMHGIMKILLGSMTVTSYTRAAAVRGRSDGGSKGQGDGGSFSASLVSKVTYTPQSEPCCLEPHSRNLHEIVASDQSVVFLDILGPPYNPKLGRDCAYYFREEPSPRDHSEEESILLKPGPNPAWFTCIPLTYSGPKVNPSINS
ncbi:2-aminoethanethiol dioxygenase-like [Halichondria panicea]|uniref:2-aminoethanethiol dioxygenase-like n=1 Tax=Halichondria panicea TaxID=6063 RepID=UPI00312B688D